MEGFRVKRQKVAKACRPCRTRKVKCDGCSPVCGPCRKRGEASTCIWDPSPYRPSVQEFSDQVEWLDSRLRLLEGTQGPQGRQETHPYLHAAETSNSLSSTDPFKPPRPDAPNLSMPSSRPWSIERTIHPPVLSNGVAENESSAGVRQSDQHVPSQPKTAASSPLHSQKTPVDLPSSGSHSVHAIVGATADDEHAEGFYGLSSAGTFIQAVKEMVERRLGIGPSPKHATLTAPLVGPRAAGGPSSHLDYVLPSRKKADSLMDSYWTYVHTLYPYLDRAQVQDDYDKIWDGTGNVADERSLMRLLNSMFALASQINTSVLPEAREQSATVFYLRARELLDVVEAATVRSVQSYLILGQYFQSTIQPHHCWVFVGLAIRTAQSLGLHLPETSERMPNLASRELLRKVWHGCVLMDRILCMVYGRPSMIGPQSAVAVPHPLPVDEENLVAMANPVSDRDQPPSITTFYIFSLKLYEILHDVLFNFYFRGVQETHNRDELFDKYFGSSSSAGHPSIFELERRLSRWEQSIPDHLRVSHYAANADHDPVFYRQAVVLHQRQLNVRLMLLRPVLSHLVTLDFQDESRSTTFGSALSQRMFLQCAIVCVMTAQEAIDTIYKNRVPPGESGSLAAWWYNVLYLYTSATVLIAARLSASILAEVSEESIMDRWNKALEILDDDYGVFGTSIRRISTTLRLLFDAVPHQYSRLRQQACVVEGALDNTTAAATANHDSIPLPAWHILNQASPLQSPFDEYSRNGPQDGSAFTFTDLLPEFDTTFDPNDISWLVAAPSNS